MDNTLFCEVSALEDILEVLWLVGGIFVVSIGVSLLVTRLVLSFTQNAFVTFLTYVIILVISSFLVPILFIGNLGWGTGLVIQVLVPTAFFAGLPLVLWIRRKHLLSLGVMVSRGGWIKTIYAVLILCALISTSLWFEPVIEKVQTGVTQTAMFPGVKGTATCADFGAREVTP